MDSVGRFMLWVIFVLSAILAFSLLVQAQNLAGIREATEQFTHLTVIGALMGIIATVSGAGLAVSYRR